MTGDDARDAAPWILLDPGRRLQCETADVVIVVERADRVPLTIRVGQRSLRIARQSVVVGLGLSVGAMFVAAFGYLPPVWGALFQEVIDVVVILNALRALHG
jgi:cation transport ATPase